MVSPYVRSPSADVSSLLITLGDILAQVAAITDRLTPSTSVSVLVSRTQALAERVGELAEAECERIVRRHNTSWRVSA